MVGGGWWEGKRVGGGGRAVEGRGGVRDTLSTLKLWSLLKVRAL